MRRLPFVNHSRQKTVRLSLRLIGPLVAVSGLVMTAIGLISFFSAFGTTEMPRYFWAAFVGLPLIAVGLMLTQFGYVGAISRYILEEGSPVVRDTFNTMAQGTSEAVETMAQAVGRGLSTGMGGGQRSESGTVVCGRCDASNSGDARFCNQCGAALESPTCPGCGASLDSSARFCNQCGKPVG